MVEDGRDERTHSSISTARFVLVHEEYELASVLRILEV